MSSATASDISSVAYQFDIRSMMRFAYQEPFTPDNIITAFEPRGLYPVDRKKLLPVSRPNDMKDIRNLISVKNWSLHLF